MPHYRRHRSVHLVIAIPSLHAHTLTLCLVTLAIITLVNLRGVRESGVVFGLPTYLFVVSLLIVLGRGLVVIEAPLGPEIQIAGRRAAQGFALSSCAARRNSVASSPKRAENITPTGKPSGVQSSGTDIEGCPVTLKSAV